MRVLLAGGSGLVGGLVLQRLIASAGVERVSALGRTARSQRTGPAAKVSDLVTDYVEPPSALEPHYDAVLLCLGTTAKRAGSAEAFRRIDHDFAVRVAQWGRARGAKLCGFVSSVGADAKSPSLYLRTKGETENDLAGRAFQSLQVFRPSFLKGRPTFNWRERYGAAVCETMYWIGLGPKSGALRPVAAESVADAMAGCLAREDDGVRIWHYRDIAAARSA